MLVLKRRDGQWLEVTHSSGDVLNIRLCNVEIRDHAGGRAIGQANLVFDDPDRNFEIERPERKRRPPTQPQTTPE